ncbi:MAG: ImmA/IrrE family metallo-endopeptidase [Pirellulales bacterium]
MTAHEIANDFLPHQRTTYSVLEDSDTELDPETHDLFEREANVFASEVLFQGSHFTTEAADFDLAIKVPVELAKKYGPSVYSTARRYVSTHSASCALVVFNPPQQLIGVGEVITLRRIIMSPAFEKQFGRLNLADTWGDGSYFYIHRPKNKFTAPVPCNIIDVNGEQQVFSVEAFNTTHHILFLLKPSALLRRVG